MLAALNGLYWGRTKVVPRTMWEWGLKTNKGVNEERLAIHFARVRTIRPNWVCTIPNVLWLNLALKNCHPATPLVVRLMRNQNLILV